MLLTTYPDGVPPGLETAQLRFAMCGSSPVPAEVLKRFEETFNCFVIEGYGLSESTCRSTFNPPDQRRRPGSCGLPIGNEMRVVDEENREVADGSIRDGMVLSLFAGDPLLIDQDKALIRKDEKIANDAKTFNHRFLWHEYGIEIFLNVLHVNFRCIAEQAM
jgi:acyl-CoA synthetase (AMP-forming)/AMP-acid ligase II